MSYKMIEECMENRCKSSPLYRLQTVHQLAELFGVTVAQLWELAKHPEKNYRVYPKKQKNGKLRTIEEPQGLMKKLQKKLQQIFKQERFPKYLSSPAKGRSPLSNVETHRGRTTTIELDIKNFYPSCREGTVFHLFRYTVCCSPQVSWILTQLVCFKGHLPTGAPSSPLLAFYAYEELFNLLYGLVAIYYRLSLWVDNISYSCMHSLFYVSSKEIIERAQTILNMWGLKLNRSKSRIYQVNKSAYITGYHLAPNGDIHIRNGIHRKLFETKEQRKNVEGEGRKRLTQKMDSYKRLIEDVEKSNKRYRRQLARQERQEA
jgi:RNA-directed DNA polymerase